MKNLLIIIVLAVSCITASAQRFVKAANSIAGLIALNVNDVHTNVFVANRATANDGGGGSFVYDANSSVSTNWGTVFKPTSYNGRWLREFSGPLDIRWFGAVSGAADSSLYIQNALTVVSNALGGSIFIPQGTFIVDSLIGCSNIVITGTGAGSILKQKSAATYVLSFNPGSTGTTNAADNLKSIVIQDVMFEGRSSEDGFSEHRHLLNMNAVSDAKVLRCTFKAPQGDGIYLGSSNTADVERHNENVTIKDCLFDGVTKENRNGISVIDASGLLIDNNKFTRFSKTTMPGPIDIEPDTNVFHRIQNILVARNLFDNCGGEAGRISVASYANSYMTIPPRNIRIIENTILTNQTSGISMLVRFLNTVAAPITTNSPKNYITITDNSISGGTMLFEGVHGGIVARNTWGAPGDGGIQVGKVDSITEGNCIGIELSQNQFIDTAGQVGAIVLGQVQDTRVLNNYMAKLSASSVYHYGITFYGNGATTTSTNTLIAGNMFEGTFDVHIHSTSHTPQYESTLIINNVSSTGTLLVTPRGFKKQVNYDSAFTLATLPDSLMLGETWTPIDGESGAPDTSDQGILQSFVPRNASGFRKFVTQLYASANNATNSYSELWIRKSNTAANTWGDWKRVVVGGPLNVNTTTDGTVGAGVQSIGAYDIPANMLAATGDRLVVRATGSFAANGNNKTVAIQLGGTDIFTTGALAFNSGTWVITASIIRTGANSQKCNVTWNSSNSTLYGSGAYLAMTKNLTLALTLQVNGTGTSDNDIVGESMTTELVRY